MVLTHAKIGLSIIKLFGTEFVVSHTFQCSVTFLLLVLENLIKFHKGDFAGHCSTCRYT